jgi:type IV secretion system protein VirD4
MAACLCWLYAALAVSLQFWPFVLAVAGYAAWRNAQRWRGTGTAYGTGRLADLQDLHAGGLLGDEGLILARAGQAQPPTKWQALRHLFTAPLAQSFAACQLFLAALGHRRWGTDRLIRLPRFHHLVTFAPPGAGKGVSVLQPNLLSYPGPCVIIDPKGENYRLASATRKRLFGHRQVRIDPFDIVRLHPGWRNAPPPDSLNPFDRISRTSPDLIDWAADLGNALVVRENNEGEQRHWSDSAELFLSTFIAFVLAEARPHERHLGTVRELLTDPVAFRGALNMMRKSPTVQRMLRRRANHMSFFIDRELGSAMTSTGLQIAWLDSERILNSIRRTSFDPGRLLAGDIDVYLCLPENQLHAKAGFTRVMLATLLRCVTRGGPQEKNLVLFLLDEAGHLGGRMRCLEDAITLLRGYGVRLWFFFQSVGQLQETFRDKAAVFLDAIDTQQWFGLNGLPSAEQVSNRLGDATIPINSFQHGQSYSRSHSDGRGGENSSWSTNTSTTHSEIGRRLLQPAEVLQLPPDQTVIFTRGALPILGKLLRYYDAPEFAQGRAGHLPRRHRAMRLTAAAFLLFWLLVAAGVTGWLSERRAAFRGPAVPPAVFPGAVPPFSPPRPPLLEVPPGDATFQRPRVDPHQSPLPVPQERRLLQHPP